jgi:long-chain acyl-CoA synthetase
MHVDTLPALFRQQADRFGARVALRYKKDGLYHDLRWNEYRDQIASCAAALVAHGIGIGDRVAILSENRVEWLVADMAILSVGAVNVPLHCSLAADQVRFQADDAGVTFLFASSAAQHDKVVQVRDRLPTVQHIVTFDDVPGVQPWRGFLQRGRIARAGLRDELRRREERLAPKDLASIIYTSGTTGLSKGVMLTHDNLYSNAQAFTQVSTFTSDSVFFNWLPYSHIYARTVDIYVTLFVGATLCLTETQETIVTNLMELQPTNMSGVPRFYEKVLNAVQDKDPAIMKKKLHAIFGPRIDFLGSGGAPLPLAVAQAFKDLGLLLLQGYGLTESSPVISFNRKDAYRLDSVGLPIPGVEVKIGEDGEVLTRGPHVMKGYWKNPQASAETIQDGWLHTGDLGRIDADGFLYINGRKKDLLVLSNGKKVVPSHIESLLLADPCIDQVVICGEGKSFLTALIVPHWANLTQALGVTTPPGADDPSVCKCLETRVQLALKSVAAWEQVKRVAVLAEPFSVANDELTISLKLRRNVIFEHHRQKLDQLYAE